MHNLAVYLTMEFHSLFTNEPTCKKKNNQIIDLRSELRNNKNTTTNTTTPTNYVTDTK